MTEQRYAGLACSSCKERKRKCDKRLPKCSLCNRKNWYCGYSSGNLLRRPVQQIPSPVSSSTIEAIDPTPQIPSSPKIKHPFLSDENYLQSGIQQINFPQVLFMDRQVSDQFQVEIPRANFSTPAYVLSHIGDFKHAHETSLAFFDTTQTWMPIISRISFYKNLPSSIGQIREDYALLLLCMGLMRWRLSDPAEMPQNAAYIAAKRYFLELELVGVVSIQVLQAGILLALYEIGHAIYPSAFISVATCARYTQGLGIDWKSKAHEREAFSWVEAEERNRVRWAVVLLDRAINIGCPNRSTLLPDPDPTTLLPVDDAAWNNGTMPSKPPAQVSSPSSDSMGRFALIAQATCLFAQVLRHINSPYLDKDLLRDEALLLDRALNSLRSLLDVLTTAGSEPQKVPFLSQTTICAIALMLLHEFHANRGIESSPSFDTVHHAQIMTEATLCGQDNPLDDASSMRACVVEASVFLPTLIYQTAVTNLRLHYEGSERSEKSRKAVDSMKIALDALDGRWRSGGVYLKILEARELRYMRSLNLI